MINLTIYLIIRRICDNYYNIHLTSIKTKNILLLYYKRNTKVIIKNSMFFNVLIKHKSIDTEVVLFITYEERLYLNDNYSFWILNITLKQSCLYLRYNSFSARVIIWYEV